MDTKNRSVFVFLSLYDLKKGIEPNKRSCLDENS